MISLFSPRLRQQPFMPVVYYYYDRADMNETTAPITDHDHPLLEIMYVNTGRVRIRIEDENITLYQHQYILLDANTPHALHVTGHGPLSMLNVEYQFEPADGRCLSTAALCAASPTLRRLMDSPCPYLVLTDEQEMMLRLLKQINQLSGLGDQEAGKLCSQMLTQVLLVTARLWAKEGAERG